MILTMTGKWSLATAVHGLWKTCTDWRRGAISGERMAWSMKERYLGLS